MRKRQKTIVAIVVGVGCLFCVTFWFSFTNNPIAYLRLGVLRAKALERMLTNSHATGALRALFGKDAHINDIFVYEGVGGKWKEFVFVEVLYHNEKGRALCIVCFSADGVALQCCTDSNGTVSSSIGDFNGDGFPEIVCHEGGSVKIFSLREERAYMVCSLKINGVEAMESGKYVIPRLRSPSVEGGGAQLEFLDMNGDTVAILAWDNPTAQLVLSGGAHGEITVESNEGSNMTR